MCCDEGRGERPATKIGYDLHKRSTLGAFVMLPAVWAPSPDYEEAQGVIANYVEALTKAAPPRVVALSSMGANRTSGLGLITALSLPEQGFRDLTSPIAFVRAGGFFENFLYGLQVAQGEATGLL